VLIPFWWAECDEGEMGGVLGADGRCYRGPLRG
jgi:hypothetical protein